MAAIVRGWERSARTSFASEQSVARVVEPAERVVVDDRAGDPAVGREHAGLGLDLLGDEDAADGGEERVAVEELEVPGQLFDTTNGSATRRFARARQRTRGRAQRKTPLETSAEANRAVPSTVSISTTERDRWCP